MRKFQSYNLLHSVYKIRSCWDYPNLPCTTQAPVQQQNLPSDVYVNEGLHQLKIKRSIQIATSTGFAGSASAFVFSSFGPLNMDPRLSQRMRGTVRAQNNT